MTDAERRIDLWCDGACSGNPGPGGWAAILCFGAHRKELSGGEAETTNNRQELRAVIEGLRAITTARYAVAVHVDSAYVESGYTKGWVAKWKRNGWKTTAKKDVLNRDLWEQLDEQVARFAGTISWVRVKGHAGIALNEHCDQLAVAACQRAARAA